MHHLSISRVWDETKHVLARDAGLFVAVGLALFVLPQTIAGLVAPAGRPGQMAQPGWWTLVAMLALLVGLVGQLAVVRLALPPATSVAEAIRRAGRRAPAFVAASLLYALPLALILVTVAQPVLAARASPSAGGLLVLLLLAAVALPLIVRVLLTSSVAVAEELGPVDMLRRSFRLTRGHSLRLVGFVLLFFFVFGLALGAFEFVTGSVILLVAGQPEPMTVSRLIKLLLSNLAETSVGIVFLVMLARIYAQLAHGEVSVPRSGT